MLIKRRVKFFFLKTQTSGILHEFKFPENKPIRNNSLGWGYLRVSSPNHGQLVFLISRTYYKLREHRLRNAIAILFQHNSFCILKRDLKVSSGGGHGLRTFHGAVPGLGVG